MSLLEFFRRGGTRPTQGGLSRDLAEPELFTMAAEIDQALQRGFRRQYFPPRLEAVFERETGAARSRYLILAGLVSVLIYNLFLFTTHAMLPDVFKTALILHFAVITPLTVVIVAAMYRGLAPALRESAEALISLLTAACTIYLVVLSKSPYGVYYINSLLLVIIFGNIVIRLRFWYATAASLATLLIIALFFPAVAPLLRTNNLIVLSSCVVFTLFANYTLEQDQRRSYLFDLRERIRHADLTANNLRLVELSHLDPLTGIPNRRELTEYLDRLALGPGPAQLAIVMMDIDNFKHYNDLYGHPLGDECLRRVAGALIDSLRQRGDMVARFGGDEFVAVLPGNDLQGAALVAERMRQVVQKMAIPHAGSSDLDLVTLSAGIAATTYNEAGDIQAILASADAALYHAKSAGRNRVES